MQDKVVEQLFHAYFADELFLNDPEVLVTAALKGGIDEATARAFVADESQFEKETREEFSVGRENSVTGVPHFVISDGKTSESLSGAQPPGEFKKVFDRLGK